MKKLSPSERAPQNADATIEHILQTALPDAVVAGLRRKKKELAAIGAIDGSMPDAALRQWVNEAFGQYRDRHKDVPTDQDEKDRRYQTVVNLLVLSDQARLITFGDWSADRTQEACDALGIRGFQDLECVLADKYGRPGTVMRHLHKGPGTGVQMYQLRRDRNDVVFNGTSEQKPRADVWQEIGVGKELCFPLHTVLTKFVRADLRENPAIQGVVRVLTASLYRALHRRWFRPAAAIADNAIDHWEQKVPVCDLNDVFPLLAQGRQLLAGTHLTEEGAFKGSGEFEGDMTVPLTDDTHAWLLRYAGWSDAQIRQNAVARKTTGLRAILEKLKAGERRPPNPEEFAALMRRFNDVTGGTLAEDCPRSEAYTAIGAAIGRAEVDAAALPDGLTPEERLLRAVFPESAELIRLNGLIGECRRRRSALRSIGAANVAHTIADCNGLFDLGVPSDAPVERLAEALDGAIRALRAAKKAETERIRQEGLSRVPDDSADPPEARQHAAQSLQCLRETFTDGFAGAVADSSFYERPDYRAHRKAGEYFDLNRKGPQTFLHNFVPSPFTEMEFPDGSFDLITAVRSDSHEPETDFALDLKKNVRLLKPGGCMLIDGVVRSYTQYHRFAQVTDAIAGRDDMRAECVLDDHTHNVKAVLIQRSYTPGQPGGYLSDEDKQFMFRMKELEGPDAKGTVYFKPVETVAALRSDLRILNRIRAQLIELSGGNVDIFSKIHDFIRTQLEMLMMMAATMKMAQKCGVLNGEFAVKVREDIRPRLPKAGWEDYGALLHANVRIPEEGWSTPSIYALRQGLMNLFQAPVHDRRVRAIYEDSILRVLREELYANCFPDEPERLGLPATDADAKEWQRYSVDDQYRQRQWKSLMFDVARNVDYVPEPYLDRDDRHEIATYIGRALFDRIRGNPAAPATMIVDRGLEQLDPEYCHTVPRRHFSFRGVPHINAHARFSIHNMPSNTQFEAREAKDALARKVVKVRTQLMRLRDQLGTAPVTLIQFDCVTNAFLAEQLRDILGNDHFDRLVSSRLLRFDRRSGDAKTFIRHFNATERNKIEQCQHGGIVIVGGSWEDAYAPPGEVFQETVGEILMPELMRPDGIIQYHGICFGQQTIAHMVGRAYGTEDVTVAAGCLEFGPGPMRVEEADHPLFKDCGSSMTVAYTHSGHVIGLDFQRPHPHIRPLARSGLTGMPVAFEACHGNVTGLQPHPEINIADPSRKHQRRLMENLLQMEDGLRASFGIGCADLERQWNRAADGVRENAGPHLLVNALMLHAERLTRHLAQRQGRV